ncbi:MAG: hypothetical protein M3450_10670 [Actinomycetota bacterium]|nr:hypothetical protein [Actinomycetota bacterium]
MDFDRRERSQRERTRREDRRLKFYELRDNLPGSEESPAEPDDGVVQEPMLPRHSEGAQTGTAYTGRFCEGGPGGTVERRALADFIRLLGARKALPPLK